MLVEQQGSIVVLLIYDVPIYYILPVQKRLPLTLWSLWSRDLGNGLALLAFVKYVKLSIGKLLKLEFQTSLDFLSWLSNILNDWKIDFFHSKSQEFQAFQVLHWLGTFLGQNMESLGLWAHFSTWLHKSLVSITKFSIPF